ncbi:lipoprotein [Spiroplasma alleghenense]|uniref:Lipoprotein n=1 Tax=Spiroplasma alleghenense TaxID=216931 RepID=A0A345Z3J7_9MOLU|nr:lipoprotein [Spiroplasma alleghenense]AXK51176.1 hypothetical protein SALLE_v1c05020 [Spiroplasma alleghenense]
MKKLLSFLAAFGLTSTASLGVVACAEHLTFVEFKNIDSFEKAWSNSKKVIISNVSSETKEGDALKEIKEEIYHQSAVKFTNNNSSNKIINDISKFEIEFYRTNREQSRILDNDFVSPMGLFHKEGDAENGRILNNPGNYFIKFVEGDKKTSFLQFTLSNLEKIDVNGNGEKLSFTGLENSEEKPLQVSFTSTFFMNFRGSKPSEWNTNPNEESLQLKRFKDGITTEISNQLQRNYIIEGFSNEGKSYCLNFFEFVNFLYTKENSDTQKLNESMKKLLIDFQANNTSEISKPIEIAGVWFSIYLGN